MTLHIEETFDVRAPVDDTWALLTDPARLAPCVPGATLGAPRAVRGSGREAALELRAGPVMLCYNGSAVVESRDDALHDAAVEATGEGSRAGDALRLHAELQIVPTGSSSARVSMRLDVDATGRLAEFGASTVEAVLRRTATEFAARVRHELEQAIPEELLLQDSLTLSGAFREHPNLKDTDVGIRAAPRVATAVQARRTTPRDPVLTRIVDGAMERLRTLMGRPRGR